MRETYQVAHIYRVDLMPPIGITIENVCVLALLIFVGGTTVTSVLKIVEFFVVLVLLLTTSNRVAAV